MYFTDILFISINERKNAEKDLKSEKSGDSIGRFTDVKYSLKSGITE